MSEQPKDPSTPAEAPRLDPTAAAAALAQAVTSAEQASARQPKPVVEEAAAGPRHMQALVRDFDRKHAAQAATLALAIALGWAAGSQALSGARQAHAAPVETAAAGIRQNQEDIVRLTADVSALKGVIEAFRHRVEQSKSDAAGQSEPFAERLASLERASQDTTAQLARIVGTAERTERAGTTADAKVAAARLDPPERPAASADPSHTGSVPDKPAVKSTPVGGWVLREVYDGSAVVEGRNGRLYEVTPGRTLPGVGRVQSIERRGRIWVVVTNKGIIGPPMRWR